MDISKFHSLKPKLIDAVESMLRDDIGAVLRLSTIYRIISPFAARLMDQIAREEMLERAATISESGAQKKHDLFEKKVRLSVEC